MNFRLSISSFLLYSENKNYTLAIAYFQTLSFINKGNNKITELRAILQRESQNS